jgi:predicted  nucleic acid-binding Zn-ribbon protein
MQEYNLDYEKRLEDDKNLLKREYSRMPKPAELERRIEQLKAQNNELSKEITMRHEEIKDLNQTITERNALIEVRKKEIKDILESVENHKNDYVQVNSLPMQISKECDRLLFEQE